jgi:hypothetical protein
VQPTIIEEVCKKSTLALYGADGDYAGASNLKKAQQVRACQRK